MDASQLWKHFATAKQNGNWTGADKTKCLRWRTLHLSLWKLFSLLLESERHHLSPDSSNSVDAVLTPACFSFGFYLDQRWEATFSNRLCLNHCWSVVYVRERLCFFFLNSSWSLTEWELWSATRPTQSAEQMFTMNVFCKPCLAGNWPVVF